MFKCIKSGILFCILLVSPSFSAAPQNVIILIGDGMGFEQIKAAGIYSNGASGTLCFESLPFQGECITHSADYYITDSSAAASAIATGHKVNTSVISTAIPGDANELETLLEYFKAKGKSTGLVTTSYISDATPAAFGAHESNRINYSDIIGDYLNQTKPNVLMGGALYITPSAAEAAGYTIVTDSNSLDMLEPNDLSYLSGQFGSDIMPYELDGMEELPHLSEMTIVALDILDNNPNGFFLMIEGALIDWACHDNNLQRTISEIIEFSNSTQVVLDWAAGRKDTLVIVTADHETGGLTVMQNNGQGVYPTVSWSSDDHTEANVPVYATGLNAEKIYRILDNTDFFEICTSDEMPADLDGDLDIDLIDFSLLASKWQDSSGIQDLIVFVESWLIGK